MTIGVDEPSKVIVLLAKDSIDCTKDPKAMIKDNHGIVKDIIALSKERVGLINNRN